MVQHAAPNDAAVRVVFEFLRTKYPKVFPSNGRQPLAVGIKEQIMKANPDLDRAALDDVLRRWTKGHGYLKGIIADGSERMNLDGTVACLVSASHRAHATKKLERAAARKAKA